MWDQLLFLQRRFPDRFSGKADSLQLRRPISDLPLFPTSDGRICSKESVAATIVAAGLKLGVRDLPDDSAKLTGHSLRVTGAQGLAALGLDLWAIQLLGRWGSERVKTYVREAQLGRAAHWAATAARHRDLEEVVAEVTARLPAPTTSSRSSSSFPPPTPSPPTPATVEEAVRQIVTVTEVTSPHLSALQAEADLEAASHAQALDSETAVVRSHRYGLWHRIAKGPPSSYPSSLEVA